LIWLLGKVPIFPNKSSTFNLLILDVIGVLVRLFWVASVKLKLVFWAMFGFVTWIDCLGIGMVSAGVGYFCFIVPVLKSVMGGIESCLAWTLSVIYFGERVIFNFLLSLFTYYCLEFELFNELFTYLILCWLAAVAGLVLHWVKEDLIAIGGEGVGYGVGVGVLLAFVYMTLVNDVLWVDVEGTVVDGCWG
jgi:hypothetical protein